MALRKMAQDKASEKVAINAKSEKRVTKSHIVQVWEQEKAIIQIPNQLLLLKEELEMLPV